MHRRTPSLFAEVIHEIRVSWRLRRDRIPPEERKLVELALRRMQQDLHSDRRREVIEEVRRELSYRRWCEQGGLHEEAPNRRFGV